MRITASHGKLSIDCQSFPKKISDIIDSRILKMDLLLLSGTTVQWFMCSRKIFLVNRRCRFPREIIFCTYFKSEWHFRPGVSLGCFRTGSYSSVVLCRLGDHLNCKFERENFKEETITDITFCGEQSGECRKHKLGFGYCHIKIRKKKRIFLARPSVGSNGR